MERERYLTNNIYDDLKDKMAFIGGPRQVGKTTLAKNLVGAKFANTEYYNWDYSADRKRLKNLELPGENSLLIFDEIHKYKKWKNFVKGVFDVHKEKYNFIVAGSSRLNIFRKGGDSLQGRYHYYTLHPFTLSEAAGVQNKISPMSELIFSEKKNRTEFESLHKFGGFPEPFVKQDERTLRRWHTEKLERLFREDVRESEAVRDINNMKLLGDILPAKASGILSINSLREDLEVSHRAVSSWLDLLEIFYYHFRIHPYATSKIRAIKKDAKIYLMDWSEVENEGERFENLLAAHLLKTVNFLNECEGFKVELHYLRNVDKKEVDFLVSFNRKPWFSVEAKLSDKEPSPNIFYFAQRLKIPFNYQVILKPGIDIQKDGVRIISAEKFLTALF